MENWVDQGHIHLKGYRPRSFGATEDQAVAAVKLDQYSKLFAFGNQREVVLRRIYKELKGTLQ